MTKNFKIGDIVASCFEGRIIGNHCLMDWQIGDIIEETIHIKADDSTITSNFLILDIIEKGLYLVHNLEHNIVYKLIPIEGRATYEKVG